MIVSPHRLSFSGVLPVAPLRDCPDRDASRGQPLLLPWPRQSTTRNVPGRHLSSLPDRRCDRSPGGIRKAHTSRSQDRAPDRVRRWQSHPTVCRFVGVVFVEYSGDGIARDILRKPRDRIESARRIRAARAGSGLQFCQSLSQSDRVQLIDGKYAVTTLRASRLACQPLAAFLKCISQRSFTICINS